MFPVDLKGLFPIEIGKKTETLMRNRNLNVKIWRIGQDEYDLLVVNTITNKTFLHRNGKQQNVMQENWRIFRDGGFQEMP